ncbi:MAG: PilZ domain-containing protein [Candidatus Omnitrophica bacterium]|nr:PilZ domain-containing protein [Candidatus Omnitrophota bacterium]
MAEKRNYVRFPCEGEVELMPKEPGKDVIQAKLVDMGFLGFCIFLDQKIEIGTRVDFNIYIKLIRENFVGEGKVITMQQVKKYRKTFFRVAVAFMGIEKDRILSILTKIQDIINREKKRRWQSGDAGVGLL